MQHERTMDAKRQVSGPDGEIWRVYERDAWSPTDARRRRDLIFDRQSVIRRVRDYPPDWRTLSDEELLRIADGV